MADKEKDGPRKPYVLKKNSVLYELVHTALNREKKEGLTPTDLEAVNPKLAAFMKDHNIIKAKAPTDLIDKHDLCLETVKASITKAKTVKG